MMRPTIAAGEVLVPAGEYVFGDPCYSIDSQEQWMELLESCDYLQGGPVATAGGVWLVAFGTAHGDGSFQEEVSGTILGVDAGLIGLVPREYVTGKDFERLTMPVSLKAEGRFTRDREGLFTLTESAAYRLYLETG